MLTRFIYWCRPQLNPASPLYHPPCDCPVCATSIPPETRWTALMDIARSGVTTVLYVCGLRD